MEVIKEIWNQEADDKEIGLYIWGQEVTVRTSRNLIKKFQTRRGVRQDCVLSPLLFNLYIANLDRELKNRNIGGVAVDIIGRYKDMELSVQTI